jgi:hypothetical protein
MTAPAATPVNTASVVPTAPVPNVNGRRPGAALPVFEDVPEGLSALVIDFNSLLTELRSAAGQ